jgi:hypothetical protein
VDACARHRRGLDHPVGSAAGIAGHGGGTRRAGRVSMIDGVGTEVISCVALIPLKWPAAAASRYRASVWLLQRAESSAQYRKNLGSPQPTRSRGSKTASDVHVIVVATQHQVVTQEENRERGCAFRSSPGSMCASRATAPSLLARFGLLDPHAIHRQKKGCGEIRAQGEPLK